MKQKQVERFKEIVGYLHGNSGYVYNDGLLCEHVYYVKDDSIMHFSKKMFEYSSDKTNKIKIYERFDWIKECWIFQLSGNILGIQKETYPINDILRYSGHYYKKEVENYINQGKEFTKFTEDWCFSYDVRVRFCYSLVIFFGDFLSGSVIFTKIGKDDDKVKVIGAVGYKVYFTRETEVGETYEEEILDFLLTYRAENL